ncbi:BEN domain-containing protein 7 isoform X2 [Scyliorhinus canicula]|uniref:BEN domain-containing protein 7 isoform X2 n=1 Tax=Scyliorhinus canicula TaxID=7830 RepID=UPI0018F2A327|nr:BEN domain-containing protein 7 isoform X2 [Scyliorhinus canicula]
MRRLLNAKVNSIRIHQPLTTGREKLKEEPGASDLTWLQHNTHQANVRLDEPHSSQSIVWKDIQVPTQNSSVSGRDSSEGSRSSKPVIDAITESPVGMPESNGPPGTMDIPLSHSNNFRSSLLRTKIIKRRLIHRNKPAPAQANPKIHNPDISLPQTERNRSLPAKRLTTEMNPSQAPPNGVEGYISELDSRQNNDLFKPEVRLAEGYDVFIPKSQLESILLTYPRSGSLLFRKLISAFFDDQTLANSLPNGKRKRGANDNRKGLDQNIVGAMKVFTEEYCTLNQIDRLPGPTDWIQILQDQIARARNRLKRGAGANTNAASSSDMWDASEPVCTVQM